MASVRFIPAFEGDEYHAPGFSCREAGVYEMDDDRASYLTETFGDRFALEAPASPAKAAKGAKTIQDPEADKSSPQEATQDAQLSDKPKGGK